MYRRTRYVLTATSFLAIFVIVSGCTPEEEQAFRDAVNTAAQDAAKQAVDFVLSFGRQALAAFLF